MGLVGLGLALSIPGSFLGFCFSCGVGIICFLAWVVMPRAGGGLGGDCFVAFGWLLVMVVGGWVTVFWGGFGLVWLVWVGIVPPRVGFWVLLVWVAII